MPDVVQETEYKGWPTIKVYYGTFNGENKFISMGVKAAAAVDVATVFLLRERFPL